MGQLESIGPLQVCMTTLLSFVNSSGGIILTNKLSIVQVIDKNTLRWFGLVMRRREESMLRVVMQLKTKGKRPRGKTTLLDSIDRL